MPRYKAAFEDPRIMLACGEREAMNRQNGSTTERRENQNSKGTATADYGQEEAATSSSIASETSRKVQKRADMCTSFFDEKEHLKDRAAAQERSRKIGAEDGQ
jgi:hypothetical protein